MTTVAADRHTLAAAERPCRAALVERVAPARRERLELVLLVPTRVTWAQGDRTASCLVEQPGGQLTGPVAGSAG